MNILEIIAAIIVPMIIGSIWYSPKVFGGVWLRGLGKDPSNPVDVAEINKGAVRGMIINVLMLLLSAIVLQNLFLQMEITNIKDALYITFMLWAGFTFSVLLIHAAYEMKSRSYFLVKSGYQLVTFLSMACVIVLI